MVSIFWLILEISTYRSAGNHKLNLATMRTHEHTKLLDNALEYAQPVVLRKRREEVLHDALLVRADVLLQFLDNLLLVRDGEGRSVEDLAELGVLLENA